MNYGSCSQMTTLCKINVLLIMKIPTRSRNMQCLIYKIYYPTFIFQNSDSSLNLLPGQEEYEDYNLLNLFCGAQILSFYAYNNLYPTKHSWIIILHAKYIPYFATDNTLITNYKPFDDAFDDLGSSSWSTLMSSAPSGSGPVNAQTGQLMEIKFTQNKLDFISPVKCQSCLESIVKMQEGGQGGEEGDNEINTCTCK